MQSEDISNLSFELERFEVKVTAEEKKSSANSVVIFMVTVAQTDSNME